jgi:hypothetical protein
VSGAFGWDYPPGCNSTPYDEAHVCDISKQVSTIMGEPCYAYWDEDDNIYACRASEMTSSECEPGKVGTHAWDDEQDENVNFARAAQATVNFLTY